MGDGDDCDGDLDVDCDGNCDEGTTMIVLGNDSANDGCRWW